MALRAAPTNSDRQPAPIARRTPSPSRAVAAIYIDFHPTIDMCSNSLTATVTVTGARNHARPRTAEWHQYGWQ